MRQQTRSRRTAAVLLAATLALLVAAPVAADDRRPRPNEARQGRTSPFGVEWTMLLSADPDGVEWTLVE